MHGWDDTRSDLEPKCDVNTVHQRAVRQRAQNCVLYASVCGDGVLVIHRSVLKRDVVMREGVRSAVAIIVYRKCS